MFALAAVLAVASGAELKSEAWVVVSQRSSVAKGTALELAKGLSGELARVGIPTPTPADDLSSCAAKVPCLVKAARDKGVAVLITLEIGSVLGDLVARVAAISIDEDGRVIQRIEVEGSQATMGNELKAKVAPAFAPAVRSLLALPDPAATPPVKPEPETKPEPKPEPVVEAPKPDPKPEPTPEPTPEPASVVSREGGGMTGLRVAGLGLAGVGVIAGVVGIILSGVAQGALGTRDMLCPRGMQCNDPKAYQADASFRSNQLVGGVLLVGGLALAAGGLALFLLSGSSGSSSGIDPGGPGENPGMSFAPLVAPGFAGVSLSSRF